MSRYMIIFRHAFDDSQSFHSQRGDESGRDCVQRPRHLRGSRAIALQINVRLATDPKSGGLSTTVDSHALQSSRQRRPFRCCASAPWRAIAGCVVPNTALAPLGYAGHGQYSTNCAPAPGYGMEFRWTSRSFRATRAPAATIRFGCRTGTRPRQWRRTSIPAVTMWTVGFVKCAFSGWTPNFSAF